MPQIPLPPGSLTGPNADYLQTLWAAIDKTTSTALPVFNVATFGASGNGVTNDTAAITAATAAAVLGGTVFFPPGTYLVSSDISIGNLVSWVGDGATIKATSGGTFTRAMILCGQYIAGGASFSNGGAGTRFGAVRGLYFDANSIAPIALYVGDCVQRVFENLDCQHALNAGLVVDAAQNCSFVGVNAEKNGDNGANDCHLLIDRGAGNNAFVRCEFSASVSVTNEAKYNVIIRQSAASPTGAFPGPTSNSFFGCVCERAATNQTGNILQMAGRHNTFIRCDLQCPGVRPLVTGNNSDGTSNTLRFVECDFTGTAGQTTGFSLATCTECTVVGGSFENFTVGFSIDDNSNVELVEPIQMGSVTTRFVATGAKVVTELVVGTRAFTFAGTPTGAPAGMGGTTPMVYDGTNDILYFYNGAWRGTLMTASPQVLHTKGYAVAALPAATTGDIAHVTDALAPAFLVAVVGGGAVKTLVFYNGAAWVAA